MTTSPPAADTFRTVEYLECLEYPAGAHPGKYDQDIRKCCTWAANKIEDNEGQYADWRIRCDWLCAAVAH